MTLSLINYYTGWMPILITLMACVLMAFILAWITSRYSKKIEEYEKENPEKEYKQTRTDYLISIAIGVIIICLIIGIVVYILAILGNQLNEGVSLCANCTNALS